MGILTARAADWPQYRGANHDGVSAESINTNWSGSVTNPVWLVPLSNSFCSFTISDGRAFSQFNQRFGAWDSGDPNAYTNKEICVALDITNGARLWVTMVEANAPYPEDTPFTPDDGPRTTSAVDGDSLFILTSKLKLYRLAVTNGAIIWQKDLLALYGGTIGSGVSLQNRNAASPLIENGLIFVSTVASVSNIMAFSTTNGSLVWRSQNEPPIYSTPLITTIHGVRQVIFGTTTGVVSLDPLTGVRLWKFSYPFGTLSYSQDLAASPVVYQDIVFITGARSQLFGSLARRINYTNNATPPWSTTQIWAQTDSSMQVASLWMTPVVLDGFLYGEFSATAAGESASGALKCVDIQTGTVMWSTNNFGRGGTLLVGSNLVVITETGQLVLVKAITNAYTEMARFQAIPGYNISTNKCWNTPALANGRIYIRSTYFGAAYDFSLPDISLPVLTLDPPTPQPPSNFQLTVRAADGSAVSSNRLVTMEVRSSTNLALSPEAWPKLTNNLLFSNGVVLVTNVDGGPPQRYFIVAEPK